MKSFLSVIFTIFFIWLIYAAANAVYKHFTTYEGYDAKYWYDQYDQSESNYQDELDKNSQIQSCINGNFSDLELYFSSVRTKIDSCF